MASPWRSQAVAMQPIFLGHTYNFYTSHAHDQYFYTPHAHNQYFYTSHAHNQYCYVSQGMAHLFQQRISGLRLLLYTTAVHCILLLHVSLSPVCSWNSYVSETQQAPSLPRWPSAWHRLTALNDLFTYHHGLHSQLLPGRPWYLLRRTLGRCSGRGASCNPDDTVSEWRGAKY